MPSHSRSKDQRHLGGMLFSNLMSALGGKRTLEVDAWSVSAYRRSKQHRHERDLPQLVEVLGRAFDQAETRGRAVRVLSAVQIADRFGTQSPRILKLMEVYGVPRRSRGAGKT